MLPGVSFISGLVGAAFLSEAAQVRQFTILAALMLSACALPGVSGGNSFMSAMHPTQDFCESRGMTLDATTKQCVTPAKTAASPPPADAVTGSLPAGAPAQTPASAETLASAQTPAPARKAAPAQPQPASAKPASVAVVRPPPLPPVPQPQQRQRADLVPIEPAANIYPQFAQNFDLMSELAHFVRASGYRCDSISALEPGPSGYKLVCNRSNYKYAIREKDGRSTVTLE